VSPRFRVLVVTPEGVSDEALTRVVGRAAAALGPRLAVQARAKGSFAELSRVAHRLAALRASQPFELFVNGDATLAEQLGAHLHVPGGMAREGLRERMQNAWISCPAHTDADVLDAAQAGFDAVIVSPILEVPGKGAPRGLSAITRAKSLSRGMHVVALGGIDASTAGACFAAGADAVALMRAPFSEDAAPSFFVDLAGLAEAREA
jgi:thiamine-phosphate pyrophosphorylase